MQQENEIISLTIQYLRVPAGAAVLSCKGFGCAVRLPEKVGGLPVRQICAYAFSSPEAALARLPNPAKVRCEKAGGAAVPGGTEKYLGGPSLREVFLPGEVETIGEYAFYNCTGLIRLSLGVGATRVGNGAFMNCGALREIHFSAAPNEVTCLPGLLTEIQREIRVVFSDGGESSVWIFPEYFEESVENAPARIFEHFIHGAGYRYRQCFQGGRLNAEDYDRQFPMARVEAEPQTVLRIALERLRHPYCLSESSARQYFEHLRENAAAAAELLISEDDPQGLVFLTEHCVLTQESIGDAVEAAARTGRAECLSVLLNERHSRFAPEEKTFDL
ncbi:MAG TPA: leucine-rich repeat protein [Caproiciproducens sp.]|nr:leucine-rich repeat protein [Caproiciproducens sp.]